MLIGDDYDADTDEPDVDRAWVIKQFMQHPLFKTNQIYKPQFGDAPQTPKEGGGKLVPDTPLSQQTSAAEEARRKRLLALGQIQQSEDKVVNGWFEDQFGKSASELIKDLRMKRRVHKQFTGDIDQLIGAVRKAKEAEIDSVLDSLPWTSGHLDAIKGLGISDRDLKALRKFGNNREVSLKQACIQWDNANDVIKRLAQVEGEWDNEQRDLWVESMSKRKESKGMWRGTLHQADSLSKSEAVYLNTAADMLSHNGAMDSRTLMENMSHLDGRNKSFSVQKLSALLKTYGLEYNITKHQDKWELLPTDSSSVIKDPWAYTAGFLDADGYITISKRGEPRAGIIATGMRGRAHCEQIHDLLNCGILQLDLKVHENSKRSQHRLQFYSGDDLRKLLVGIKPHLRLKKKQAECVLQLLDLRGRNGDMITKRRDELYKVVKWENWKDVKSDEMLDEWNVDEQEVLSWGRSDPEVIRLVDDMSRLVGDI
jgi:hypothetical protein